MSFCLIILAGMPPIIQLSGISFVTTALGATNTLLPMLSLPKAFAPGPKATWSPIIGLFSSPSFCPINTPALNPQ